MPSGKLGDTANNSEMSLFPSHPGDGKSVDVIAVKPRDAASEPEGQVPYRAPPRLKFCASGGFDRELRRRVDRYCQSTGLGERDYPQMYVKRVLILGCFAVSYALLIFIAATPRGWWTSAMTSPTTRPAPFGRCSAATAASRGA